MPCGSARRPWISVALTFRPPTLDDVAWVAALETARDPSEPANEESIRHWWQLGDPERVRQYLRNVVHRQREEAHFAPRVVNAAIRWLEQFHRHGRFYLHVEIFDPHEPFYCTDRYRRRYGDTWEGPHFDWPSYRQVAESPAAIEHVRKCYAGLLTMTDHWVGKLLDWLDRENGWDDTLVILTTDHGTMLAEHGYWMKNYMPLYHEIVRIPLILHRPGGEAPLGEHGAWGEHHPPAARGRPQGRWLQARRRQPARL